jgi:hypothetical protein
MRKLASRLAGALRLNALAYRLASRGDAAERRRSTFVRRRGGEVDVALVVEYTDGTAFVSERTYDENMAFLFDDRYRWSASARREVSRGLPAAGYVELAEALRRGLLTKDEADHPALS